ncbi:MAG: hypothetical protein KF781_05560 [Chitinophagaceae bacterium]|nr:hypothetical protein [Chitinophagaceae bacterium]MCW5905985.1 hypothetical protein [Chitinophagaceae bacterium]
MKYLFLLTTLLTANAIFAQSNMPYFLQGTWKMDNKEIYEHWDKLNNHTLKGFSYKLKNNQMIISEYLTIEERNHQIIYTATVINQNNGEGIAFQLTKNDSSFIFENPTHDFPKKIIYQKLAANEIFVQVSDGKKKGFSYKMMLQNVKDTTTANPNYDKALAQKLGADDYGMKSYFLVILKTGTNTTKDKELISKSFREHLNNINKLVDEGKLIIAGPLGKNENAYRGIFVLNNLTSIEEAKTLLQTDPAIQNQLLDFEIFTWYGSAALAEYLPFSDKIWKLKP